LKPNLENKNGFVHNWDSTSSAPFLCNKEEKIFITYDDEESLKEKCTYIKNNDLKASFYGNTIQIMNFGYCRL
jgi:chitinase